MNVWLSENEFVIATDTYCYSKENGIDVPKNYLSKTYYLPQHRCCFTNQGLRDLGVEFFKFAQTEVVADDILSLLSYTKDHFNIHSLYPEVVFDKIGTIFLFGLSNKSKKLEAYKIYFGPNRSVIISQFEELGTIFKPQFENQLSIIQDLQWNDIKTSINSLIEVMLFQKKEDDLKGNEKVGIGGEIQLTILTNQDGYFSMQSLIVYKFDDYDMLLNQMK